MKLGPDLVLSMLHIAMEPDDNDPEDDSPVRLAIANIDTLSTSLPPSHVVPPLLEQFPKLAASHNPCERRAAMAAIGALAEGAADFISNYIEDILPHIFVCLRDSEAFVIRAALIALSQVTEQLPTAVLKHHAAMVPVVFELLGSSNSAIMKAACNSLDAMLEWVPKDTVAPYLPKLMDALIYIMRSDVDPETKVIVAGISSQGKPDKSGDWNRSPCI